MTERAAFRALERALEKIDREHMKLGEELKKRFEESEERIERRASMIISHDEKLNSLGEKMVALQSRMNDIRAAMESLELAKRDGAAGGEPDAESLSVSKILTASAAYQRFADDPELHRGVPKMNVGSVWQRERRSRHLATRADNNFDNNTNPDLVKPDFREEVVLFPKNQPIIRSLSTVLTTDSNKVQVDRELVEYPWVSCASEAAIATATTMILDNVTGLGTTAPYNVITVENAGGPEELTISAIDTDTREVTFAPALSNPVAAGDRVSAEYFLCTPEGAHKPQSLDITEAVDYEVCKIASYEKASDETIMDDARARQLIDNRLLSRQARMEDKASLYGPGGAKQWLGIFPDADVPRFDFDASLPTGTSRLDHIIDVYYEGAKQNYVYTACVLHPDDHKLVARSKDDEGAYIFPLVPQDGAPLRVFSMMLLWSNQLERDPADIGGDFVMGDLETAITYFDRMADTIEVGFSGNDFVENLRTIRIERRGAFAILHPLALAKGTFVSTPAA